MTYFFDYQAAFLTKVAELDIILNFTYCIAHQDYTRQERINFVEAPGHLYYSNGGSFIPGTIEKALVHKGPQRFYRNRCLCTGMVNFNMIDTVGRGIKKMFSEQKKRFFPMPDYEIDHVNNEVGVTVWGKMLDEKYTSLLKENKQLTLQECVWLDAIQKRRPVTKDAIKHLRQHGYIEGKAPHYTISLKVAKMTGQVVEYTRTRGLDREKICQMVVQFVQNAGSEGAKRDAIYEYVKDVLPSNRTIDQQERLLGNILAELKTAGKIRPEGRKWIAV